MKKMLIAVIILSLFLYVFFESGTWQTRKVVRKRGTLDYVFMEHRFHWERFVSYIKNIPDRLLKSKPFKK